MRIGLFDSGVGGLFLLKTLSQKFPGCSFMYLADLKNFPYGEKPISHLQNLVRSNVAFLQKKSADVVLVACNTAEAAFQEGGLSMEGVHGIIDFSIQSAAKLFSSRSSSVSSAKKKLGVLATTATVDSSVYPLRVQQLGLKWEVYQQACPRLAPWVESSTAQKSKKDLDLMLKNYVHPLIRQGVEVVILGCTHYLYVEKEIGKALHFPLVQPAGPLAFLTKFIDSFCSSQKNKLQIKKAPAVKIFIRGGLEEYRQKYRSIVTGSQIEMI